MTHERANVAGGGHLVELRPATGPTIRLRPGAVTFKVIDGEAVLLDIARSEYLGMNGSATALLELLRDGAAEAELVAMLLDRFDVSPVTAARDVELFLESCAQKGWLDR